MTMLAGCPDIEISPAFTNCRLCLFLTSIDGSLSSTICAARHVRLEHHHVMSTFQHQTTPLRRLVLRLHRLDCSGSLLAWDGAGGSLASKVCACIAYKPYTQRLLTRNMTRHAYPWACKLIGLQTFQIGGRTMAGDGAPMLLV